MSPMSRRKPAKTAEAAPEAPERAEGPNPDRGGAFYRRRDGSLVRDRNEEQAVPEEETAPLADAGGDDVTAPPAGDAVTAPPAGDADTLGNANGATSNASGATSNASGDETDAGGEG